jgi:hypothetical protein
MRPPAQNLGAAFSAAVLKHSGPLPLNFPGSCWVGGLNQQPVARPEPF